MERKVYNAPRAEVITFDEELLGGTSGNNSNEWGGGAQDNPEMTPNGSKSHGFDLWD